MTHLARKFMNVLITMTKTDSNLHLLPVNYISFYTNKFTSHYVIILRSFCRFTFETFTIRIILQITIQYNMYICNKLSNHPLTMSISLYNLHILNLMKMNIC